MNQSTLNKLNQMHLWGMEATLKGILGSVQNDKLTADELVELLVQSEWEYRENQKISRCLNNAAFRYQAFIDNIDYSPGRKLDKNLIMRLADCSYIERAENVIITGATGVGKSYIATALGHQACLKERKSCTGMPRSSSPSFVSLGQTALMSRRWPRLRRKMSLLLMTSGLKSWITRQALCSSKSWKTESGRKRPSSLHNFHTRNGMT